MKEQYVEPSLFINYLEDELNTKFNDIKEEIKNAEVTLTGEEISQYLKQSLNFFEPDLASRIKARKSGSRVTQMLYIRNGFLKDMEWIDDTHMKKYTFEPYTLEYFKKYISIVKTKCEQLINIIEKIMNRNTEDIEKLLLDLDIKITEGGLISLEDFRRLAEPTVYNIENLRQKVKESNTLYTYLNFHLSKEYILNHGLDESDFYPDKTLQYKSLAFDGEEGYISLSHNQKQELRKEENSYIKKLVKIGF